MNKEFIPYEQALELKELGFKGWCLGLYPREQDEEFTPTLGYVSGISAEIRFEQSEFQTLAPLYQQAFKWFREKYNIHCSIGIHNHSVITIDVGQPTQSTFVLDSPTYEQAELDSLNKMIDIVNLEK